LFKDAVPTTHLQGLIPRRKFSESLHVKAQQRIGDCTRSKAPRSSTIDHYTRHALKR